MGFYRERDELDEANGLPREIDTTMKLFGWVYGIPDLVEERVVKDGRHQDLINTEERK